MLQEEKGAKEGDTETESSPVDGDNSTGTGSTEGPNLALFADIE